MQSFFARLLRVPGRYASALLCVAALLWLPQSHAWQEAQASAQTSLTLADAIRLSFEQNPQLAIYQLRDIALDGQAQTAKLRPAMELGAELENFAGSSGAENAELTIALSSVVELGGKRQARVNTVNAARDHLQVQRQLEALELMGEVIRRYVEVLTAQEKVTLANDSVNLARDTLGAVQKRVSAAAAPVAERLRAESALAQAHLSLSAEQRQLQYHKLALAVLWNETSAGFKLDSSELYRFGPQASFAELYTRAQQNPAIARFASEERLREFELRLAETQNRSDIDWSVGLRRSREIEETTLVAGFSLPLFPAKRNAGAVTSAMAAREQVGLRREAALLQLHTQLYRAFSNREQAMITARALQANIIPGLSEALVQIERAYRRGRYSYLEWAAAREELISARRAQIQAAGAALRYGAEIEQLTAEPLVPAQFDNSK